jgi:hypothetical protein
MLLVDYLGGAAMQTSIAAALRHLKQALVHLDEARRDTAGGPVRG